MSFNQSGPVPYDSATALSAASNTTDLTLAFPSNVAIGDLLLSLLEWYSANTIAGLTVTDSLGNTWQAAYPTPITQGSNVGGHTLYYCIATHAGANTITYHATTSAGKGIGIARLPGQAGLTAYDTSATATGSTNVGPTAGPITPSAAGNLLVSTVQADGGSTWAADLGWNTILRSTGNSPNDGFALAIKTCQDASAVSSLWLKQGAVQWCTGIASFSNPGPAASGGGLFTNNMNGGMSA